MLDTIPLNFDLNSEDAVLSVIMDPAHQDKTSYVCETLVSTDFYSKPNQIVFRAVQQLNASNEPADLITVGNYLTNTGEFEKIGGDGYLMPLISKRGAAPNIASYCQAVKAHSKKRQIIAVLNETLETLHNRSGEPINEQIGAVLERITHAANEIIDSKGSGLGFVPMREALTKVVNTLERRWKGEVTGITTGIKVLDDLIGYEGVSKTGLFGIAARPKMGKTTLALKIAEHIALDLKKTVAIFSMEMSDEEIAAKSLSQLSGVTKDEMGSQRGMSDAEWAKVNSAMGQLNTENVMICDRPNLTLNDICYQSRKLKRERGELGAIFVDYLTLMKVEKAQRMDLAFGEISKGLKNLAKELKTPVFVLAQLNRGLEQRPNKRPIPADIREVSQLEQDLDYLINLYRQEVYYPECQSKGAIELILTLNRHGETGTALAGFNRGAIVDLPPNYVYQAWEDEAASEPKHSRKTYK